MATEMPIVVPGPEDREKMNYCTSCKFEYNYILGNPTVTKTSSYIEINTDTPDQKEIRSSLLSADKEDKAMGKLQAARIYCPSLNDYSNLNLGGAVISELILVHKNTDASTSLSVCIPITKSSSSGAGSDGQRYLHQVIKKANSNDRTPLVFGNNFTLNSCIPRSSYLVIEGLNPSWEGIGKNDKNRVIILNSRSLVIDDSNYQKLKNMLSSAAIAKKTLTDEEIEKNITRYDMSIGEPGIKHRSTMTCYPIDTDGNIVKAGYISVPKDVKSLDEVSGNFKVSTFLIALAIVVGVPLVVWLGRKLVNGIAKKAGAGSESADALARVGASAKSK